MKIERVTYFHYSSNDRPGEGSNLLNSLHQHNVDVESLWSWSAPNNRAEFYVIAKNPAEFKTAAGKIGISYEEGTCFRLTTRDERGVLDSTLSTIARKGINLTALHGTALNGQMAGYLWCKAGDVDSLAQVLNA